ncbi:hypothetical protein BDN70DRAFT_863871 [Pholiota conissans]|uniref:Fungal-type protein kinase domain-containing protein n=1 Tax=Pholiota conissans TaxID=109636 RepID=A0A9P5YY00_9AGAR|nr:hypothetical protein BDN70DRAFT_863871 [Pholiota conissans]
MAGVIEYPNISLISLRLLSFTILPKQAFLGRHTQVYKNVPAAIENDRSTITQYLSNDVQHRVADEGATQIHNLPQTETPINNPPVPTDDSAKIHSIACSKTRLRLETPFINIRTPKDALMVIYDLLEITRHMYLTYQPLHCNLNCSNVFSMKVTEAMISPPAGITKTGKIDNQFCSIRHLLNPSAEQYETSTLLLDFDLTYQKDRKMEVPRFQARAVRLNGPDKRLCFDRHKFYYNAPALVDLALPTYATLLPDRLARFPCEKVTATTIKFHDPQENIHKPWHHRLHHDAESAHWLLLWWAITSSPPNSPATLIGTALWIVLAGSSSDGREQLITCSTLDNRLDPVYSPLENFLSDSWKSFSEDVFWATEAPYTDSEYVHESFQRYLLNFLVDRQDEAFMNSRKHQGLQKVKPYDPSNYYQGHYGYGGHR